MNHPRAGVPLAHITAAQLETAHVPGRGPTAHSAGAGQCRSLQRLLNSEGPGTPITEESPELGQRTRWWVKEVASPRGTQDVHVPHFLMFPLGLIKRTHFLGLPEALVEWVGAHTRQDLFPAVRIETVRERVHKVPRHKVSSLQELAQEPPPGPKSCPKTGLALPGHPHTTLHLAFLPWSLVGATLAWS